MYAFGVCLQLHLKGYIACNKYHINQYPIKKRTFIPAKNRTKENENVTNHKTQKHNHDTCYFAFIFAYNKSFASER